jgi:hypothetical protein
MQSVHDIISKARKVMRFTAKWMIQEYTDY